MRNKVAKAIRKASSSIANYRLLKKAWKRRNVDDSPKNPPVFLKKKHKGEPMKDFKARRKRANLRKRKRRKRCLCLVN